MSWGTEARTTVQRVKEPGPAYLLSKGEERRERWRAELGTCGIFVGFFF